MRDNLRAIGSDLIVRRGKPEQELQELVRGYQVDRIVAQKEVTSEDILTEEAIRERVDAKLDFVWEHTLFHRDDMPYELGDIPKVFTNFRKQCEKRSEVRECLPTLGSLPPQGVKDTGEIPPAKELGMTRPAKDRRAVLPFSGGEDAALERLESYFWDRDQLKNCKFTRNGLLGAEYSSKFSPWVANGSLSPRRIYWEVKKYEQERNQNVSTYWMIFELIWRDFFRYVW